MLYVIMKCVKLRADEVSMIPMEKNIPEATPILLYPNLRSRGPLIRPSDIPKAENVLTIMEASVADMPISAKSSLYINPKL